MGDDEAALLRLWREKRGEVEPEDLSSKPDRPARHRDRAPQPALVRAQYRPGRHRGAAAGVSSGQALDGGNPGRHGRGDRRRLRGQVHAAMVVLGGRRGREAHGPAAAQHVGHRLPDGGAVDHYRRRQMGRDDHSGRSALPASPAHGRKEVLALRRNRRDPSPVWRRAATGKDRGGPDRRYERVQRLGRVCRPVSGNPAGGPGPRAIKDRVEGPGAGGCQGSLGSWRPRQALEVGRHQL